MRFASLGSGSGGNATVIGFGDTYLLVDCGFSMREAQRRLERLGMCLSRVTALLVTHEHGDHVRGVPLLARRFSIPVFMTAGTLESRNYGYMPDVRLIRAGNAFQIGGMEILPVAVAHDAREPVQYIFRHDSRSLGVLTDLGSFDDQLLAAYSGCDGLLLEANHDPLLLAQGPYPATLKRRVAGPWGHLSNHQAAELLSRLDTSRLRHLVVGHISRKNNSLLLAQNALATVTHSLQQVHYACQEAGFDWLELA